MPEAISVMTSKIMLGSGATQKLSDLNKKGLSLMLPLSPWIGEGLESILLSSLLGHLSWKLLSGDIAAHCGREKKSLKGLTPTINGLSQKCYDTSVHSSLARTSHLAPADHKEASKCHSIMCPEQNRNMGQLALMSQLWHYLELGFSRQKLFSKFNSVNMSMYL